MDGRVAGSEETRNPDGAEALRVEGLTVQYGALVALRDVSWSVRPGEILGIIGPNGAGKSSCFAAVTNAVRHSGQTFLDRDDVSAVKTFDLASRGLRRTFQQNSFFGELTVLQNAAAAIVREFSASLADLAVPAMARADDQQAGGNRRRAAAGFRRCRRAVSRQAAGRYSLWRAAAALGRACLRHGAPRCCCWTSPRPDSAAAT